MSVTIIPIECKFGNTSAYVYYIDAPEPAVIDTGVASSVDEAIAPVLEKHGKRVEDIQWILLTHGHVDHLGGARALWEKTGKHAKVVIPEEEAHLLRNRTNHLEEYRNLQGKYVDEEYQKLHQNILLHDIGEGFDPDVVVNEGDRIHLGGDIHLTVVETPGHSEGLVTYLLEDLNWAFASDAIQLYGGAQGKFPTIEDPRLYRASLLRLKEEIRPERLYLGHHFIDEAGEIAPAQLEGSKVNEAIEQSLQLEEKLSRIYEKHAESGNLASNDDVYQQFKTIAEELDYTNDPRNLPCAFFVTMNGYDEIYKQNSHIREEVIHHDSEKI